MATTALFVFKRKLNIFAPENKRKIYPMKKIITLVVIAVIAVASAQAQTYFKTNALYIMALLPNVQVETKLIDNLTFQGEINASLWQNIKDSPQMGAQFIGGARWYVKEEFNGFYVGGDAAMDVFRMSKWNYWGENSAASHREQRGFGIYFGATVGYQMKITKRINLDFYAGGGWHLGFYRGYVVRDTGVETMYVDWNKSVSGYHINWV